jgi:predicted site-specific integrase-resolvase
MTRRILRLQQIEDRTGIPIETLRWYRKTGKGPRMYVLAGRVVCDESDLDDWLDEQRKLTATGGAA